MKTMNRRIARTMLVALAVLGGAFPLPGRAQSGAGGEGRIVDARAISRIDSTLAAFVERGTLAGVSALIHEKGEEVYFRAYGMADRDARVPMDRNTIVQIFSMTKPITGVALMTLFEQGAFALDDPVAKYAPEFAEVRVYAGEDAAGRPILEAPRRAMTIRDLTRHTAGFATGADNPGVGPLLAAADPMDRGNTLTQMAAKLASVPLLFHPGERWAYGPSVDVQAYLVERISGVPFERYLRERIFEPLGMMETRYFVPESDRGRFSAIFRHGEGGLTQQPREQSHSFNTSRWALTPGGWGLTSTLDDYMRFALMLQQEGVLGGERILKPETVAMMATDHLGDAVTERMWLPSKGRVGFGIDFAVRTRPPASAAENNGAVGEFFWDGAASTLFWVDPANDLTAVLFVQLMPFDGVGLHKGFREAVYGGE